VCQPALVPCRTLATTETLTLVFHDAF
jgi:hypothetical protein